VRQWGSAATVVSPPEFRKEIIDEVREMARCYGMTCDDPNSDNEEGGK
jgi:predicted DNA-binding transcriptional regulator YafY